MNNSFCSGFCPIRQVHRTQSGMRGTRFVDTMGTAFPMQLKSLEASITVLKHTRAFASLECSLKSLWQQYSCLILL